jgi:hypothetical protein
MGFVSVDLAKIMNFLVFKDSCWEDVGRSLPFLIDLTVDTLTVTMDGPSLGRECGQWIPTVPSRG